jgi:hypothetical protein
MGGDGFTIREVSHNFTTTPTVNDDTTKGFVVDSRWILDNGDVYVCTDATTGDAVWELQSTIPTLQEVLEEGNITTEGVIFGDPLNDYISIGSGAIGIVDTTTEKQASISAGQIVISDNDLNYVEMSLPNGFVVGDLISQNSNLNGSGLEISNDILKSSLASNFLQFDNFDSITPFTTTFSIDKLATDNGNYLYPTGASSPLATLLDIPTIDATPTDGSSNAVSSNGVFDALALKQDKSKSETFVLSKANGTFGSHTGTTAETVLFSADISAGEFTAGDFMRVMLDITKVGTAGTANVRLRAGTAGTTSDALIGTLFLLSGTLDAGFIRERFQFLSGNLLSGIQNNYTSAQTDIALNSVIKQSTSLTPSNAWKLTVTVALTNSADTVSCLGYRVSKIKTI